MLVFELETKEALKAGRVRYFVFFDFMFVPIRVHCGDGPIEWDGHAWVGTRAVLRTNLSHSGTSISSFGRDGAGGYHRGHVTASLPLDSTTREVVAKGYYRDRKMELFLCSFDEEGKIIERVDYAEGSIVNVSLEDNIATFTAEDETLDSVDEIEQRRKKTIEDFRAQFRGELSSTASNSGMGWLMNLLAAAVGNWIGIILDALAFFRRANRRALAQRWHARKRTYWFTTTPSIPYKWKRRKGYAIRADTLAEAKHELYDEVVRKIWLFPRHWINMMTAVDGTPLELLNLDHIRQAVDRERWKATNPLRQWGSGD